MPTSHDPFYWISIARDVVAFAIAAGTGIFFWYQRRGARHWPITYGKVEYGLTSDADGWRSNLMYSYTVDGEFYSGVHPLKARNEAAADEQVRRWKGQNLAIRYSPRDAAISVLRIEDQASLSGGEFQGH